MEITITFLTPTFLYGADQTRPEFRIPSLIGQMRYWWRMTQKWGDSSNIANMREEESKIFGLSDKGAKSFCLWVTDKKGLTEQQATQPQSGQPHGSRQQARQYMYDTNRGSGLSYFFYPFNQSRREKFSWFAPQASVQLEMDFLKKENKPQVLLSLFLLSCFGGLGARSRRGAGAMEVSLAGCDLFNTVPEHPPEEYLLRYVRGEDRKTFHEYFSLIHDDSPLRQALSRPGTRYCRFQPVSGADPLRVLGSLGTKMQCFRTKYKLLDPTAPLGEVHPDFRGEASALHGYYNDFCKPHGTCSPPPRLSKDAFGLPRIINFSTGRPVSNALTIAPFAADGETGRRASPLHITVNRRKDGNGHRYHATLLVLWDGLDFLPDDDSLPIRIKHQQNGVPTSYPTLENPGPEKLELFMKEALS